MEISNTLQPQAEGAITISPTISNLLNLHSRNATPSTNQPRSFMEALNGNSNDPNVILKPATAHRVKSKLIGANDFKGDSNFMKAIIRAWRARHRAIRKTV